MVPALFPRIALSTDKKKNTWSHPNFRRNCRAVSGTLNSIQRCCQDAPRLQDPTTTSADQTLHLHQTQLCLILSCYLSILFKFNFFYSLEIGFIWQRMGREDQTEEREVLESIFPDEITGKNIVCSVMMKPIADYFSTFHEQILGNMNSRSP